MVIIQVMREISAPQAKVWGIISNLDRANILAWDEIYAEHGTDKCQLY